MTRVSHRPTAATTPPKSINPADVAAWLRARRPSPSSAPTIRQAVAACAASGEPFGVLDVAELAGVPTPSASSTVLGAEHAGSIIRLSSTGRPTWIGAAHTLLAAF